MKNVHILSTDKPSRLHLAYDKYYYLSVKPFTQLNTKNYKSFHIYITSDEEIKERDWYLTFLNKEVIGKPRKCEDSNWNFSGCKKIILTTDKDLIKDGVQAIDDEFLEWFVKNPSCEYVEVKRNKKLSNKSIWDAVEGDLVFNNHNCGGVITQLSNDIRVHIISENGEGYVETATTSDNGLDTLVINNYKVCEYSDYKIIIPKEKPKQEMRKVCKCKRAYENPLSEICSLCWNELYPNEKDEIKDEDLLEPKQETLEEAAYRLYPIVLEDDEWDKNKQYRDEWIEGAKWQAERMYSEADKIMKFLDTEVELKLSDKKTIERIKWYFETYFEQFKKK